MRSSSEKIASNTRAGPLPDRGAKGFLHQIPACPKMTVIPHRVTRGLRLWVLAFEAEESHWNAR